jgi:lysozyme
MWSWRLANVGGHLRIVDAVVRRRAAEIALFLEHPAGRAAVPGALVRPLAQQGYDDEAGDPGQRSVIIGSRTVPEDPAEVSTTAQSSTQAAARAVSERIARILGEAPPQPASPPLPPPAPGEGPTPEEITDALKALVGDEPAPPPAARGKGPPEGIERRRGPRLPETPASDEVLPLLPPAEGVVVDDLEIVNVNEQEIERAIQENGHPDSTAFRSLGAWLPYALLSGLGLVGAAAGVQRLISQASKPVIHQSDVYAGPVLALGGGFLFVIAAYYLFRALTRQD